MDMTDVEKKAKVELVKVNGNAIISGEGDKEIVIVTIKHINYLNNLRESGETNMYGAAPYVQDEFALSKFAARKIVAFWMTTFGDFDGQG